MGVLKMGRREDNIKVFADTRTFVNEDENLRKLVADTINRQKIIFAESKMEKNSSVLENYFS